MPLSANSETPLKATPRAAAERDAPTSGKWRGREIEWVRASPGDVGDYFESLPRIELAPLRSLAGEEHDHEADVCLHWPRKGLFDSRNRADWSGTSIGSGPSKPSPTQPCDVASGLRASLREHALPPPAHWDIGLTSLGEWWILRATWTGGPAAPANRVIEIDHDVRSGRIRISAGLRRPSDATILSSRERAMVSGPRLTGRRPRTTLLRAIWSSIDELEANLDEWNGRRVGRPALSAWVRRYITPEWGPETGPRILLRHEQEAGGNGCNLSVICWTLASSLLGIDDIDHRRQLEHEIQLSVDALASPLELPPAMADETPAAPRVH